MSQLFGMVGNGLKAARRIKAEPNSQPRSRDTEESFNNKANALLIVSGTSHMRHN